MKYITLDPEKWIRGESRSRLLRGDGKMCCMGIAALAYGNSKKSIRGYVVIPSRSILRRGVAALEKAATATDVYIINDRRTPCLDDEHRVKRLNDNLELHQVPFRFTLKEQA